MPVIQARPADQKETVTLRVKLTKQNHATLAAYTAFLGEEDDMDYVVNQLIETVLAKDKDFIASRRVDKSELTKRGRAPVPPTHDSGSGRNGGGSAT